MELKYVRHSKVGFIVWPKTDDLWHAHVGDMLRQGYLESAGFCRIARDGCICYGFSESLQLGHKPEDSALLTQQIFG